jgi:uncharacterized repeat protein (TIGR01451 family)
VGQTFSYTLKASNAGPNDSMSTTITDPLPSGVTFVSATPSSGTCSGTTTVTCNVGAVFAGDSATVTLTVKAAAPGTATNTASVSSSEPDSNPANNSASASVTINPAADLALTKTASVGSTSLGSGFSYTLKATNAGPDSATGTTVSDPLPSDVSFVSSSTTVGSCSGTATVTCNLGTLASGASGTVTIKVKAAKSGTAVNTAKVSSSTTDLNLANNSASATITIGSTKGMKLSVSPGSVVAGAHKCFAFRATSSGKGVGGVSVKFAGKKAHTSSKGKARVCLTLKHKGTDRASATKKGYRTAHVSVHVKPKPAKKRVHFTG